MKINTDIIIILGAILSLIILFLQSKIAKAIFLHDRELWQNIGAPGGWFWIPPRRSFFDNWIRTGDFWRDNILGLENESVFPESIRRIHRIYYSIAISILFLFIAFIFTLIYFKFHED